MNDSKITMVIFYMTIISTLFFTSFIAISYVCDDRPFIINGYVVPKIYSDTIVYFPCSGETFAKSLAYYIEKNNLEVCGLASKNSIWTKGYIVAIKHKEK